MARYEHNSQALKIAWLENINLEEKLEIWKIMFCFIWNQNYVHLETFHNI